MRILILFTLTFLISTANAQSMTWAEWEAATATNKRLQPKYGKEPKTLEELQADSSFIAEIMQQEKFHGDRRAASDHMIGLGFNYMYRGDLKTAMYRFNQAYLFDSTNSDVHWGYGAVYMTLGNFAKAKQQYDDGLLADPENTHLLTDLATYYQQQRDLDSALICLNRSYAIDPNDQNTTFKLSTVHYYAGDCTNAWRYYDECTALGGKPITEAYTKDLKAKCKRRK